jgi:hypothetical protein
MKPAQSTTHSLRPSTLASSQATAVTAAMTNVARALLQLSGGRMPSVRFAAQPVWIR